MIGAVLAFGGVQPVTYSLMVVVLFLCLLLLVAKQTLGGKVSLRLPPWPLIFAVLVLLQLVPLPSRFIMSLSPARFLELDVAGLGGAGKAWTTLSVYPHDTVLTLLKFLAYLCAFLLAAYVFDSRKRGSTLIRVLIFLGCFEAVYGIVQYLAGWHKIFTYTKQFNLEEATGTYINRNHYAGLLGLVIPFALAAAFYSFQRWAERWQAGSARARSAERTAAAFQSVFYLFLLVIMFVGVVFSRSRAGILAAVFSTVFIALLAQLTAKRKVWMVGVFLFLLCVAGYGLWIGLDPVLARFEQMREPGYLQLEGRVAIWKDTVRLVRDYPLVGTGLGTFGIAFRRYQTGLLDSFVDHAHNDYLEFASDTGLLGATLLFAPILYLLGKMIVSLLEDTRRFRRAVILGCIGSTLSILLHSAADFNLQIPANALVFAVVLGVGYKAASVEPRAEAPATERPPSTEHAGHATSSGEPGGSFC